MISKKVIKHLGLRVKLMALGIGTYYRWDSKNQQLSDASALQFWSMCSGCFLGVTFPLFHSIQAYYKMNEDGLPEDVEDDDDSHQQGLKVGSLIIEFGEIVLVTCIFFLNVVSIRKVREHKYLLNQLINYNKTLQEMIDSGKLELDRKQKRVVRAGEMLLYLTMVISLFLPLGIVAALMHPVEPTHVLIKEWLDLDFKPTLEFVPLIIPLVLATYGCGTTVSLMMTDVTMYYLIATMTTDGFTPERISGRITAGNRCKLETPNFGVMEDSEIASLYRTQHVLNVVFNDFYESVLISFHHVGCLAAAACLICFAIRYHDIIAGDGVVAYLIVFTSIFSVFLTLSTQSKMAGDVVDASNNFRDTGRALTPRSLYFNKFSRSCQTFYLQVAYPFYTVHKETFLLFCEQVLDYVLTLLLW